MKRERDPWGPLAFVVFVCGGLVAGLVAVSVVTLALKAFGLADSFVVFGVGSDDVCVQVPVGVLPYGDGGSGSFGFESIRKGISQSPVDINLCDQHASTAQHLLYSIDQSTNFLFFAGFLLMAALLIRAGRRHGTFTPDVAGWLTRIGLYVVLGTLVLGIVSAIVRSQLVATMTTHGKGAAVLMMFSVSVPVLIAGFGALTAGRVMARSVALQREVETLV